MIDETLYNLIKNYSDFSRGYHSDSAGLGFTCIFCGEKFEKGVIYPVGAMLLEAERGAAAHVEKEHGSPFYQLLDLGKEVTGLSEIQGEVLKGMFEGRSDRETAARLGGKAVSTVRNHRFHLRKQKREAMILLSLMELIENRDGKTDDFLQFHGQLPVHDDRTIVTRKEADEILKKYVSSVDNASDDNGSTGAGRFTLKRFPRKQKEKLVLLNRISELFSPEKKYTEKEINAVLSEVHEEYVEIRRYLVDYGFLDRKPDGSSYWVVR
jgi:hypothetical protein